MVSQESNVYLVKTTYIINPVIKSCDGNNGFILILNKVQNNQLDCLKKNKWALVTSSSLHISYLFVPYLIT